MPQCAVLLLPGHAGHRIGVVQALEQIDDQLFTISAADEVDLFALRLDELRVERREDTAERKLDVGIGGSQLTSEHLGVGVACGRQKANAHEIWLLAAHLFEDDVVGRFGVSLVEHRDLVAGAFEHRREGHDADGGKPHHLNTAVRGPLLAPDRVELRVANVDQEGSHGLGHFTAPRPRIADQILTRPS